MHLSEVTLSGQAHGSVSLALNLCKVRQSHWVLRSFMEPMWRSTLLKVEGWIQTLDALRCPLLAALLREQSSRDIAVPPTPCSLQSLASAFEECTLVSASVWCKENRRFVLEGRYCV
eukprot:4337540-Amphidinium_carterae.2